MARVQRSVKAVIVAACGLFVAGLSVSTTLAAGVPESLLKIKASGPQFRYKDREAIWEIQVTNSSDGSLQNVVVRGALPPELDFVSATDDGRLEKGRIVWKPGTLSPGEAKTFTITATCKELSPKAVFVITASASGSSEAKALAAIEIRGLAAFRVDMIDMDDPVEVGKTTEYRIYVTNQGSLPGKNTQISFEIPKEMKVVGANGPSAHTIAGQQVTFKPVDSLKPRDSLDYSVKVRALKAGDVRCRVILQEDTLAAPVLNEESTSIIPAPAKPAKP